jgi:hypothetical protein
MKNKSVNLLKKFEVSFSNKTHSFSFFKCDCCNEFTAIFFNKENKSEHYMEVNSLSDYFDVANLFSVMFDDGLLGVTLYMNGYSEKKSDKIIDKFFRMMEEELGV